MRLRYSFSILLLFIISQSIGQRSRYPQGYFQFPIKPGQAGSLSGSFGDLRTNHFHAGLDIRTEQREGLSVYAAADGYVERVKISPVGYGNAIYLKHPNGYTTVYGHLKTLHHEVQRSIREKQYANEDFEVDMNFGPNQHRFRKGDLIGISGNSGSSGGPHLHFEIRDEAENAINPLFFGFPEIQDNIAPSIEAIALKPFSTDAVVNGDISRYSSSVFSRGYGTFGILAPIYVWGEIGLEILTSDKTSNSPFKTGISQIDVQLDGSSIYWFNLEKVPFESSRDINAHIDFGLMESGGSKYQRCYKLEGNRLDVYSTNYSNGKIVIRDTLTHQVNVLVKDANNNLSTLNFILKGQPNEQINLSSLSSSPVQISTSILGNILNIKAANVKSPTAEAILIKNNKIRKLQPSFSRGSEMIYRHDLQTGIPEIIEIEDGRISTGIKDDISVNGGSFSENNLTIRFGADLYEKLYLRTAQVGTKLSINDERTPLKANIDVTWQPTGSYNPDKAAVYYVNDGTKYLGGHWAGGGIQFKTRELGDFQLLNDFNAPVITPLQIDTNSVRFRIKDNLSGVKSYRCTIDSEWLLMNYDAKNHHIWSEKYDDSDVLNGFLRLEVTDNSGNVSIFETDIEEYITKRKNEIKRRTTRSTYRGKKSKKRKR